MLDQTLEQDRLLASPRVSFKIDRESQVIRQTTSLVNVLAHCILSNEPAFDHVTSFRENAAWLMDTLIDTRMVQRRWDPLIRSSTTPMIILAMKIASAFRGKANTVFPIQDKAIALLTLFCSDMVTNPEELVTLESTDQDFSKTYCIALIAIIEASLRERPIGRLAASKLVDELHLLSSQSALLAEGTDIWVCHTPVYPDVVNTIYSLPLASGTSPKASHKHRPALCLG